MSKLKNNTEAIRALLETAKQLPEDGYYEGYDKGKAEGLADGRAEGKEIGYADALAKRTDLVATENGEYTPSEDSTGFKSVSVAVSGKLPQIIDKSVTKITAEDLQGVTSIGGGAFYECKKLTYVNIPDGVKNIGERAFWYCTSLPSIEIPEGVTSIGGQAFYGCSSLKSANIHESVTSIGTTAFQGCSSLVSINIPSGVEKIDSNVFTNCSSLPSIEIPAGVNSIGYAAFSSCTALKNVILKSATPPTVNSNSFNNVPSDCVFTVPYGSGEAYKSATNWSARADYIVEGDV